jgi:MerR family transcriptional regulator, multidrug-efflux activator
MKDKNWFGSLDVDKALKESELYREEVDKRFDPELVAESRGKTSRYSKEDWAAILQKGSEIHEKIARQMDTGVSLDNPKTQELIKGHHSYIDENFYTCSKEVYRGLGEMYTADERFAATFNKVRDGLAEYISTAISHYCGGADGSS